MNTGVYAAESRNKNTSARSLLSAQSPISLFEVATVYESDDEETSETNSDSDVIVMFHKQRTVWIHPLPLLHTRSNPNQRKR